MNLLQIVACQIKCDPALVYFYAYHYNEIRKNRKQIARGYIRCDKTGVFPDFVNDWCLDFLNGVIKTPKGG